MPRRLRHRRLVATAALAALVISGRSGSAALTFVSDTYAGAGLGHVRYRGAWEHLHDLRDGRFFGTSSRSNDRGASIDLRFSGRIVRIYGVRGPNGGDASVTIDGVPAGSISFAAASKTPRALVFASDLLDSKTHDLHVERLEDRHIAGGDKRFVNISGFVYIDGMVPAE